MVLALVCNNTGAQTIARMDENDSLIIRKNLNEVMISSDHIEHDREVSTCHYSENVDEVIEGSSGISLTRRGNYASEVVVRGLSSERLNLTIDGMKIFSACTDKMDPVSSYVSANNLKSVSCEKGGEGKCYGSSTGGQVDFRLKDPKLNDSEKVRSNLSLGLNSVSLGKQASFNTNYSEKNWAIRLNAMATKHGNYLAGGGEEMAHSQYSKTNFALSTKFKISANDFIQADVIADDARDVGYPSLPMDVAYATGRIYSVTYKKYLDGRLAGNLKAKIYGNNIRHLMDDAQREVVMHMDMPGLSDTYGSFLTYETSELKRNRVNVTIDVYKNRSFAEMTMFPEGESEMYMVTWPDVNRTVLGIYASETHRFKNTDELMWTGRIDFGESRVQSEFGRKQFEVFRYDVSEPFTHRVYSTSLSYSKALGAHSSLTLETSYSERLPSVSEQFGYYIFNSMDAYDYIGDPLIKNESAYKAEIGHRFNHKKLLLSSAVYAMHMPNYILGMVDQNLDGMTLGSNGVKQYANIAYAQLLGFEVEATLKLKKWLEINTSFTYTYGQDADHEALPLIPPLKNRTRFLTKFGRNMASVSLVSAGEQNRIRASEGEQKSPAYAIVDLQYSRRFGNEKHGLFLMTGADNIFDTNYYDHLDWNALARPGRNFFVKVQYRFN